MQVPALGCRGNFAQESREVRVGHLNSLRDTRDQALFLWSKGTVGNCDLNGRSHDGLALNHVQMRCEIR
jgi:hypothetical protein